MVDVGLNWYLNKFVKVYMDWEHASFGSPVFYNTGGFRSRTTCTGCGSGLLLIRREPVAPAGRAHQVRVRARRPWKKDLLGGQAIEIDHVVAMHTLDPITIGASASVRARPQPVSGP